MTTAETIRILIIYFFRWLGFWNCISHPDQAIFLSLDAPGN